ncbi:MAG TPA: glycosyltransferase family 4 protein [Candidatus Baltobacteraceae bacterium]|nr:glycosyltransferase family 4 protein [Candidatus Baltobacteraceae bacterium]
MRLLLATYEYPPDLGGVASYLGGLFGALTGARVKRFRMPKRRFGWLWHLPKLWLASRKADVVVVSHVLPLGTAAMLVGKPYVVIVHGLDLRSAAAQHRKKTLATRVLKGAKLVVANSHATADELAAFGIDPGSALVLTPAVDLALAADTLDLGLEGEKIVLSVGRLVPRKGFDRLIRILPELRRTCGDVRLVIAGSGPEEDHLRQDAVRAGVDAYVRFLIAPERMTLASLYRESDVFALAVRASEDDVEGFGIVLLEAALFGLPVVSSRVGGIPEAVEEETTGLLVDPGSESELAEALKRILCDAGLAKRLGEAGRARVLRAFTWESRAEAFLKRLA